MQLHCLVKSDISALDSLMLCYTALAWVAEQIAYKFLDLAIVLWVVIFRRFLGRASSLRDVLRTLLHFINLTITR